MMWAVPLFCVLLMAWGLWDVVVGAVWLLYGVGCLVARAFGRRPS